MVRIDIKLAITPQTLALFFHNLWSRFRCSFASIPCCARMGVVYKMCLSNSEKGWQKSFFIYSKWYAN